MRKDILARENSNVLGEQGGSGGADSGKADEGVNKFLDTPVDFQTVGQTDIEDVSARYGLIPGAMSRKSSSSAGSTPKSSRRVSGGLSGRGTPESVSADKQIIEQMNRSLERALWVKKFADRYGLLEGSQPEESSISQLFGETVYVHAGSEKFKSMKGHAAAGSIAGLVYNKYQELEGLKASQDDEKLAELTTRQTTFLKAKGVSTDGFANAKKKEIRDKIHLIDLATWESLHDAYITVPTSGSFGISFLKILETFRNTELTAGDQKFKLLATNRDPLQSEGYVHLWTPEIEGDDTDLDLKKKRAIVTVAGRIGCKPKFYSVDEQSNRDVGALKDAIDPKQNNGDSMPKLGDNNRKGYCLFTNPMAANQVAHLFKKIKDSNPGLLLDNPCACERNGAKYEHKDRKITAIKVGSHQIAGIDGLMVRYLDEVEGMHSRGGFDSLLTSAPASSGSTFVASAALAHLLQNPELIQKEVRDKLKEAYPGIGSDIDKKLKNQAIKRQAKESGVKPGGIEAMVDYQVIGIHDSAYTEFVKALDDKELHPKSKAPDTKGAVGLVASTKSDICVSWANLVNRGVGDESVFTIMQSVDHPFMDIASVILFLSDIDKGRKYHYETSGEDEEVLENFPVEAQGNVSLVVKKDQGKVLSVFIADEKGEILSVFEKDGDGKIKQSVGGSLPELPIDLTKCQEKIAKCKIDVTDVTKDNFTRLVKESKLLSVVDARFPERAGASALAGVIQAEVAVGNINAADLALYLRERGVNKENFFKLINKGDFFSEAGKYPNEVKEFISGMGAGNISFSGAMAPFLQLDYLRERAKQPLKKETDYSVAITVAITIVQSGHNGTEVSTEIIDEIVREAERVKQPRNPENVRSCSVPTVGGGDLQRATVSCPNSPRRPALGSSL